MYKDFRVCLKLQPQLINKNIISNGNLNLENSMTSALKLSEQVDVSQMAFAIRINRFVFVRRIPSLNYRNLTHKNTALF